MTHARRTIGFTHIGLTTTTYKSFDCNELTFINKGTQDATIDGILVLVPGDSITYTAWPGELNKTIYGVVFPSQVNGCLVVAVCKNYTDE